MLKELLFKIKKILGIDSRFITTRLFGKKYKIINKDHTTRLWYGKEWNKSNRGEFYFLSNLNILPESLIFNLGAHQGIVASILHDKFNKKGKIIAVEINKENAKSIKKNFELNKIKNYAIENAAIHEFNSTTTYKKKSNSKISNHSFNKIKSLNIEYLVEKYGLPSLIYMDVEGSECLALRGARKYLEQIKFLFIEVHSSKDISNIGGSKKQLFEILRKSHRVYYALNENESNYRIINNNYLDILNQNKIYLVCKSKKLN